VEVSTHEGDEAQENTRREKKKENVFQAKRIIDLYVFKHEFYIRVGYNFALNIIS
jgi:hypothetical protein